jgi:MFS family permease
MLDSLRSNPTVRALAELYTGTFLSGAWAIIIPTIPVLAREFGVSAGGAAQVVTAFALGKFVGTAIGGIVLDRMGTRFALVGGPMAASDAALGAAWVPWFTAILALALIMGAADSLWATAREIAGIDLAQRHQRGRVISSLHGTYNIGTAMGPFLGGWLTDVFQGCVCRLCYCHRAFGFLRNRRPRLSGRDSDKKSCGSGFRCHFNL